MNRKSNIFLSVVVFVVSACLIGTETVLIGAENLTWHTSYSEAVAQSRQSGRPIMACFTGSDWCHWCQRLEAEIFNTAQFKRWANENVVLLSLDFPAKKVQPNRIKRQNENLRKKYNIQGFPTVVLIMPPGKEVGRLGYLRGGPEAWIKAAQPIVERHYKCGATRKNLDIIATGAKLKKLAGGFKFTEGPAVDAKGNIFFTDQPNNKIHKWSVDGKLSTFHESPGRANGLYFDKDGNLLACADLDNELWSIDTKGNVTVLVRDYKGKKLNGPNDLWEDLNGGIYFTDPFYKRPYWKRGPMEQDGQYVYYLTPNREKVIRVANDLVQPNGIVGTPDGKMLYVADIGARKTYVYNINPDGTLSDKKLAAPMGSDGMTIDNEGNIYLTGRGVTVFNSKGEEIKHIDIDERWTANVCFGGKDRHTLFITAQTSLYSLRMRVKGVK